MRGAGIGCGCGCKVANAAFPFPCPHRWDRCFPQRGHRREDGQPAGNGGQGDSAKRGESTGGHGSGSTSHAEHERAPFLPRSTLSYAAAEATPAHRQSTTGLEGRQARSWGGPLPAGAFGHRAAGRHGWAGHSDGVNAFAGNEAVSPAALLSYPHDSFALLWRSDQITIVRVILCFTIVLSYFSMVSCPRGFSVNLGGPSAPML